MYIASPISASERMHESIRRERHKYSDSGASESDRLCRTGRRVPFRAVLDDPRVSPDFGEREPLLGFVLQELHVQTSARSSGLHSAMLMTD